MMHSVFVRASLLVIAIAGTPEAVSAPVLNPDVAQGTIQETICRPGYTHSVRPATSFTNKIKRRLMREEGIRESDTSEWALDHILALTLGGHPRQLANLQLLTQHDNSRKSRIEVKLTCFVCTGQMSLEQAQTEVVADWRAAYQRYAGQKCRR